MRPSQRLVIAVVGWTLLGLLGSIWPVFASAWKAAGLVLALMALADSTFLFGGGPLRGSRILPGRFALGVATEVTLNLNNLRRLPARVEVFDGIPSDSESDDLPWNGVIPASTQAKIIYQVRMMRRGLSKFEAAHVLVDSPMRLWRRLVRVAGETEAKVLPNYEPVVRFALMATANREDQMGIIRRRRTGATLEFHQLRDYHDGDVLSRIDWKATARRRALISREFEEQRHQSIILMPDCGRRMRALDGDLSQFDHCLNAMLLISFIALRQGDEVGIVSFGGADRWLAPVKSQASMPKILGHLYDYETSNEPSDFEEAAERLMAKQKRRALVILLTNLRTEDCDHVIKAVRLMQRRHLVLLATLREAELEELIREPVHNLSQALTFGTACSYFLERQLLLEKLRAQRVFTVDETAQNLAVALANRYLDVKSSGSL